MDTLRDDVQKLHLRFEEREIIFDEEKNQYYLEIEQMHEITQKLETQVLKLTAQRNDYENDKEQYMYELTVQLKDANLELAHSIHSNQSLKQQKMAVNIKELKYLRELSEKNRIFMVELFKGTNEIKEHLIGLKQVTNDIYKS